MYENIVLPVELDGDTVDQKFLDEIVRLLGLEHKLKNMPNNHSGGQQHRVALARALITKAAIVLADEPTGNLDSKTSAEVLWLIKRTSAAVSYTHLDVYKRQALTSFIMSWERSSPSSFFWRFSIAAGSSALLPPCLLYTSRCV